MRAVVLIVLLGHAACSDNSGPVSDLPQSLDHGTGDLRAHERSASDRPASVERARDASIRDGLQLSCTGNVPGGGGSVNGSVNGQAVSASNAVAVKQSVGGLKGYAIGFIDASGSCSSVPLWVPTAKVVIQICSNAPGSYAVGANCKPDGGVSGVFLNNSVSIPQPGADTFAKTGSITIQSFDASCGGKVKGSFTATFASGTLSGTFDTVSCGEVKL